MFQLCVPIFAFIVEELWADDAESQFYVKDSYEKKESTNMYSFNLQQILSGQTSFAKVCSSDEHTVRLHILLRQLGTNFQGRVAC